MGVIIDAGSAHIFPSPCGAHYFDFTTLSHANSFLFGIAPSNGIKANKGSGSLLVHLHWKQYACHRMIYYKAPNGTYS